MKLDCGREKLFRLVIQDAPGHNVLPGIFIGEKMITLERLLCVLNYDKESGVFTWKKRRGRCSAGAIAGSPAVGGYIKIRIDRKDYQAHRLAWLYVYGGLPESSIDHINRCPSDNRISNLRAASLAENQQNRNVSSNNKSGYTGVYFDETSKKWKAFITLESKTLHLGCFASKSDAIIARQKAKERYHKFNSVDPCQDQERNAP
jgi:hypothetical protein